MSPLFTHGRRRGLQSYCATHFLNISEKCEAFVLCECKKPEYPPQRCWIGGQVDRIIVLRWCAWAERCSAAVAVPHFQAVEVNGGRTRCDCLVAVVRRTVDAPNQKVSRGVLGRTSLCTQPQLMAVWHSLLCSNGDVHTKIEVSINRIAERTHRVGLDAFVPIAQTMVGRVLVRLSV
ncbi:hypothetical protein TcCL_NonESM09576 [Trypanosoma cruzi]|nr:hypothetical protein TcCL_NonESM09576 [Trypanosoma cruzi]